MLHSAATVLLSAFIAILLQYITACSLAYTGEATVLSLDNLSSGSSGSCLILTMMKYLCIKHGDKTVFVNLKS